jgi:hypothetical protein
MRSAIILFTVALLCACATGKPAEEDYVTRVGVIKSREVVDLEQARSDSRVNTSVSASVSSGRGLSIGLGVLLSGVSGGASAKPSVRYSVELLTGEEITVYHESDQFQVDDCVEIRTLPGDDARPPMMKRIPGGCQAQE